MKSVKPSLLASCMVMLGMMHGGKMYAQQTWTLNDCTRYALEHNLQIQQAQNSVETAKVNVKQYREAMFPSLTFNTQQSLGFQKVESQSYGSFDSKAKNPSYNGNYGLQASVTLYNGGANWKQYKQSKINEQQSSLETEITANGIQVRLIEAYYQILYAHESVLTNEEIVKVAQQELERTQARFDAGKVSKVDVSQMQSQLEQNRYQLVQAQNTEAANILSLKQLLQLSPESEFSIDYRSFSQDDVMALQPSVSEAQQMAMNNLPDLRNADLKLQSSQMQIDIAKGGYKPTISLNAGVSTSNGNALSGSLGKQLKNHLYSSIGLSVNVPIYDRRQTRSQVDKAKIQYDNQLLDKENTRLDIKNTISSLHLDILGAQARYKTAVSSEEAARQTYEVINERYGVGLETLVDVLTEKNNYLKARQETLQSKFTALLNQEILKFYIGK